MRIGIMLRAIDEKGGIGNYTRTIVPELLQLDKALQKQHEYVLFYRNPDNVGRFRGCGNVTELVVHAPNKALWDQAAIPLTCRRYALDVLFHPKFTAPLLAPCPVVMTVHGADWLIPQQAQYYSALDVRYMRTFLPLYLKKCTTALSVAQLTTEDFNRVLDLPEGKIRTVYLAPARRFRRVEDLAALAAVRERYGLPERFILTLAKVNGDRRKNVEGIFRAYAAYHARSPQPAALVVGGKGCEQFRRQYDIPSDGYGSAIAFPGWIEPEDAPALYTLADHYLYPSNLEAFAMPVIEAMACGTPVVTSNINGSQEIAGDAALLVDPQDIDAIAAAMERVMADPELRESLSARGLARARQFTWDRCAAETLAALEEAACSA